MKGIQLVLCLLLTLTLFSQTIFANEDIIDETEIVEMDSSQEVDVVEDDNVEEMESEEIYEELIEEEEESIVTEDVSLSSPKVMLSTYSASAAKTQFEKGSIGFFEACGATKAVSYLKNATYKSYTDNPSINGVYNENDATSLENMIQSLAFIKECNSLRKKNGLSALYVTHEMMAIAQSDVNVSDKIIGHCNQYYVSENLAWGYSDPFDGWYTKEKKVYDYKQSHPNATDQEIKNALGVNSVNTGHYLNIINKSYIITGFACYDSNSFTGYFKDNNTTGQVFYLNSTYTTDGIYTVDDYESMLLSYYNNLLNQMSLTISYNANGGSGAPANQSFKAGTVTISNTIPSREGYSFVGWGVNANDVYASYNPGDSINLKKSLTLYAIWEKKTSYTLTYNLNGGTGSFSSKTVSSNTITLSSSKPTKKGYYFLGWSKSATATTASYKAGQTISIYGNMTLYAVWEANFYCVRLDAKGGSVNVNTIVVYYDSTYSSLPTPTKTGYTFEGWYLEDGTTKITSSTKVTLTEEHYLFAHWSKGDITIEGYSVTASSQIGLHCWVSLDDAWLNSDNDYMRFSLPDGTVQKVTVATAKTNSKTVYGNTWLLFSCYVSAKDMTSTINFRFYHNGSAVGTKRSYSIQKYVNQIKNSYGESSSAYNSCKAMMTYGYYAQSYFGYNTNNLPTIKNSLSTVNFSNYAYKESKASNIDFVGARLLLKSKLGLKLYFTNSISKSNISNITTEKVTISKEGNYTVVTISNIDNPTKVFTIQKNSYKLQYSIYSYAYAARNSSDTNLKNLMKAMYAYYKLF